MADIEKSGLRRLEIQPRGRIKYVLFDMDGTLLDSMAAYPVTFAKHLHNSFHIPLTDSFSFFLRTLGTPTHKQVEYLVKKQYGTRAEKDPAKYLEIGDEIDSQLTTIAGQPFDEVPQELDELKSLGFRMAVSSSHRVDVIETKLKVAELDGYFEAVFGGDPTQPKASKRNHIAQAAEHFGVPLRKFVRQAAYIGDSSSDMKLAAEQGVTAIGRQGTLGKEKLEEAGATVTLDDLAGLRYILLNL